AGGGGAAGGRDVVTVQEPVAGVASVFEDASIARTSNSWPPLASRLYDFGDAQAPQLPASSRHWKDELVSEEMKLKLALELGTVPTGASIMYVSGGVVSRVSLGFLRGFVPSSTSRPSAVPSASVSLLRGSVRTRRTSKPSFRPSRSVSARRGLVCERSFSNLFVRPSRSPSRWRWRLPASAVDVVPRKASTTRTNTSAETRVLRVRTCASGPWLVTSNSSPRGTAGCSPKALRPGIPRSRGS